MHTTIQNMLIINGVSSETISLVHFIVAKDQDNLILDSTTSLLVHSTCIFNKRVNQNFFNKQLKQLLQKHGAFTGYLLFNM
jgi:hypothetical protein